MTRPCLRDGCNASAGPLHSECPVHRLETAALERFIGGDGVAHLAADYRLLPSWVEHVLRDELRRLLARRRKWRRAAQPEEARP